MEYKMNSREMLERLLEGRTLIMGTCEFSICKDTGTLINAYAFGEALCAEDSVKLKPKTININGFEVPEPCRKALEVEATYYYFNPYTYYDNYIDDCVWENDKIDSKMLSAGLLHLTKEAAEIHAKALISFTRIDDSK
jgi:hypothetical protein